MASLTQVSAGEVHAVLGSRRLVTIKQNKKQSAPFFFVLLRGVRAAWFRWLWVDWFIGVRRRAARGPTGVLLG